jgi:N-acetylglucosaminyldiphosphoundecaprenol N-acetyl-beta-D-mannosaminyltransferase
MRKFELLNVRIDSMTFDEILDFVRFAVRENKKAHIATVNNEFVVEAYKNEKFANVLRDASLCIADSVGIVWAIKRYYDVKIERTPGADLFERICAMSQAETTRIYLLGGEKGIAEKSKHFLQSRFKGIHIVGFLDGKSIDSNGEDRELISEINRTKPNVLFVALGSPKQELWISKNLARIDCNVFIGIGGTLDFISGRRKRAPKYMRKAGLEWFFRLIQEPRRFRRILNATLVFPYLIIFKRNKFC